MDHHNGQQVPEGVYIVKWEHGDEWSAKAMFIIGYPKFVELASLS